MIDICGLKLRTAKNTADILMGEPRSGILMIKLLTAEDRSKIMPLHEPENIGPNSLLMRGLSCI